MWKCLVALLYPPACLLCHRRLTTAHAPFCESCHGALSPALAPCCQRCGVGLAGAYDLKTLCARCRDHPLAFEKACAPLVYAGVVREAIHGFKYHGHHRVGRWLAARMAQTAQRELPLAQIDLILPVPMYWLKQRLKGVNPAAFLAQAASQLLQIPYVGGALRRIRWTPTQTRFTRRQRLHNVHGAFRARRRQIADRRVLLVDDVLTTGATAHTCAVALQEAGIKTVFVLTAARAPHDENS